MSVVAIVGAGDLGGAIADALARRARFRDVRLVDPTRGVAEGKALDIRQATPIEGVDVAVTADADPLAAASAEVIVLADAVGAGEWRGETGLALVRQIARAGITAPLVFAGPGQTWLMEAAARELGVPRDRLIGSAAAAMPAAVRLLASIETNASSPDISVNVVGRPPRFVIAWSAATLAGSLLADRLAAHQMLAIADRLNRLWPPRPQAIAAATARLAEGLAFGSRRHLPALTVLDDEYGARGVAALLPIRVGQGRVLERLVPSLSPQERVEFVNTLQH